MLSFGTKAAIVAGLGGLTVGYDVGVISGALPYLDEAFDLSPWSRGLVAAMSPLGHLPGAPLGGFLADHFGRKVCMALSNVLFVAASFVLALSTTLDMLLAGRFLVGVAVSLNVSCCVPWVSEVVPTERRGALIVAYELFLTVGVFVSFNAYLLGVLFADGEFWRPMFGVAAAFAAAQMLLMMKFPESPAWLVSRGRIDAARKALEKVISGREEEVERELRELLDEVERSAADDSSVEEELCPGALGPNAAPKSDPKTTETARRNLRTCESGFTPDGESSDDGQEGESETREMRREGGDTGPLAPLEIDVAPRAADPASHVRFTDWKDPLGVYVAVILLGFLTGGLNVRIFAPEMFQDMKLSERNAAIATSFLGLVKVLSTVFAIACIEKYGRRPLLLMGTAIMVFAATCMVIGMAGWSQDEDTTEERRPTDWQLSFATIGSVLYTVAYQLSYGPLGFAAVEMFPPSIRARVIGGMDVLGNVIIALASQLFPIGVEFGGYTLAFSLHLAFCAVAFIVSMLFFVETKGKDPVSIRADIATRRKAVLKTSLLKLAWARPPFRRGRRARGPLWRRDQGYETMPKSDVPVSPRRDNRDEHGVHETLVTPNALHTNRQESVFSLISTDDA